MYCYHCGNAVTADAEVCEDCGTVQITRMVKLEPPPIEIWTRRILWAFALSFTVVGLLASLDNLLYVGVGALFTLAAELLSSSALLRVADVAIATAAHTIDVLRQQLQRLGHVSSRVHVVGNEFDELDEQTKAITDRTMQGLVRLSDQAKALNADAMADDLKQLSSQAETLIEQISELGERVDSASGSGFLPYLQLFASTTGEIISTVVLYKQLQEVLDDVGRIEESINKLNLATSRAARSTRAGTSGELKEIRDRLECIEKLLLKPPDNGTE